MREEAPSVMRASARMPPPPAQSAGGGNLDAEQRTVIFLLRAERGGGGLQRSCKTEGVLLCAQAFGAALGQALEVLEAEDQTAEALPACLWRAA